MAASTSVLKQRAAASIEIPMHGKSDEVIVVELDESLPNESDEIVEILRQERPNFDIWRRFAVEYYHRGLYQSVEKIFDVAMELMSEHGTSRSLNCISILDSHAAYEIARGTAEKDEAKQAEHFAKATIRINSAEDIDPHDINTWLVKALLLFKRNDFQRAKTQFAAILNKAPDNVPALLGKACIEFNNGDFAASITLFKRALRVLPEDTAHIRLGIGLCYHQLNKDDKARKAYNRCLEMEPKNVQALVGLGMLDMNSNNPQAINNGLQSLRNAYNIDKTHPLVLNQLAYHFFHKQAYDKVENLAKNAYHLSKIEVIQAESCLILAKSYHAQDDYDNAFNYYIQAVKLSPSLSLAQFGLGQMYLLRGENDEAVACFETVLKTNPNNYETLKILGSLYGHKAGKQEMAIEYLKKVVDIKPDDAEAWIELAEYLEGVNLHESMNAYQKSLKLLEDTADAVIPPDLVNNIGALHHKLNKFAEASSFYKRAADACDQLIEGGASADDFKGLLLTIKYNKARLLEDTNRQEEAVALYTEIVQDQTKYIDAHLRLGIIALQQHDESKANQYFKTCLQLAPSHPDVISLMAQSNLAARDFPAARKRYEEILKTKSVYSSINLSVDKAKVTEGSKDKANAQSFGGNHDVYALVSLGSVCHRLSTLNSDKNEQSELQKFAFDVYMKSLQVNVRNPYAANGVAALLAERGHFAAAKEIFSQVRDVIPDSADVWTNLAHVNFEMGLYSEAIKIYESALKKLYDNADVPTILYLARAHFHNGKAKKEIASIEASLVYLERALHINPWDMSIRFNIALTEQELAQLIGNTEAHRRTMDQVVRAQLALQHAKTTFDYLSKATPYPPKSYEHEKAKSRLSYVNELIPWLAGQLQKQEKNEAERRTLMAQIDAQQRQQESEKLEEAKKHEEELLRKEDEARRINVQLREDVQRKFAENQKQEKERAPRGSGKRKRKGAEDGEEEADGDEDDGDDNMDEAPAEPRTPKPRRQPVPAEGDEDASAKKKRHSKKNKEEKRKASASQVDESAGGGGGGDDEVDDVTARKKLTKKTAYQQVMSSDEDESASSVPSSTKKAASSSSSKSGGGRLKKRAARQMDDEIDSEDEDFAVGSVSSSVPAPAPAETDVSDEAAAPSTSALADDDNMDE